MLRRYSNPELSPSGHLLETAHKAELAADLQRAILARKGGLEESPLERAHRQLVRPTAGCVTYNCRVLRRTAIPTQPMPLKAGTDMSSSGCHVAPTATCIPCCMGHREQAEHGE